ncbi:hypothetical protein BgiMline_021905, partial [Biomphalaria glabrata]
PQVNTRPLLATLGSQASGQHTTTFGHSGVTGLRSTHDNFWPLLGHRLQAHTATLSPSK